MMPVHFGKVTVCYYKHNAKLGNSSINVALTESDKLAAVTQPGPEQNLVINLGGVKVTQKNAVFNPLNVKFETVPQEQLKALAQKILAGTFEFKPGITGGKGGAVPSRTQPDTIGLVPLPVRAQDWPKILKHLAKVFGLTAK